MFDKIKSFWKKAKNKKADTVLPMYECGALSRFAEEISQLNGVTCYTTILSDGWVAVVIEAVGGFDCTKCLLPSPYYYSPKNGITNKDISDGNKINLIIADPITGQWVRV